MGPQKATSEDDTAPDGSVAARRFSARLGRFLSIYTMGLVLQLLIGLATTVLVVRRLQPAAYGELGLYLLVPSFILTLANMGLLQGTNRAVFERSSRSSHADEGIQSDDEVRRVLGTGLCMSLCSGGVLALAAVALAPQISSGLGGAPHGTTLVLFGAISGALAGGWRLMSNALRYARRPIAWTVGHTSRAGFSLIAIIVLLDAMHSLLAVILGFAIGTLGGFLLCLWIARDYISIAFDRSLAKDILVGARAWVLVVLAYYVVMSTGVYFVSLRNSATQVGLFSLASSLAVAAHYLVSAFIYSAGPLRQSALRVAVSRDVGESNADAAIFEGFFIAAAVSVLVLGVFARQLVEIAPHPYAGAAPLVPVLALVAVGRGYFAFSYSLSPDHNTKRFQRLAGASLILFIAIVYPLDVALGAAGVAVAGATSFAVTGTIQLILGQRAKRPMPLHLRRILVPTALTAVVVPLVLAVPINNGAIAVASELGVVALYVGVLVVTRVVPVRRLLRDGARAWSERLPPNRELHRRVKALCPSDVAVLRDPGRPSRSESEPSQRSSRERTQALLRYVAILRWLGGVGEAHPSDAKVAQYLLYRGPYGRRDYLARQLMEEGFDPVALDELEQLAARLRRLPRRVLGSDTPGRRTEPVPFGAYPMVDATVVSVGETSSGLADVAADAD